VSIFISGLTLKFRKKINFYKWLRPLKKLHMRGVEERGMRRTFSVRRSEHATTITKQMDFFSGL